MIKPSLTKKQKNFADSLLAHPKASATSAAMQSYNAKSRHVARQIARENLQKPAIMAYLHKHSSKAEETVVEVMNYATQQIDKPQYARLALDSANSLLDRTTGKPAQTVPNTQIDNITINFGTPDRQVIDLTEQTP